MTTIEPDQLPAAKRLVLDPVDRIYRWDAVVFGVHYAWISTGIDGPLYVRTGMRGKVLNIAFVDSEGTVHATWQSTG